jgi:hypothetical protein
MPAAAVVVVRVLRPEVAAALALETAFKTASGKVPLSQIVALAAAVAATTWGQRSLAAPAATAL